MHETDVPIHEGNIVEGRKTPWRIAVMDGLEPDAAEEYLRTFYRFTEGFNLYRYVMMSLRPVVCYEAVDLWMKMQPAFKPLELRTGHLELDREVVDGYGFRERGQLILAIQDPRLETMLAIDVAGYMFGFDYSEIGVGIGNEDFLSRAFTNKYQSKYPEVNVRFSTV
ncbi:MAG: hypothetical protein M1372_02905 [Patescibacteria group bacterium]|nr:hypothetical protein [Patescibacteria group bacterium]